MMTTGGHAAPIQIKAQFLRTMETPAQKGTMLGLGSMLEEAARDSSEGGTRRRASWRESDLKRAISAAEKAGLTSYRVEIAPDGTISIAVGYQYEPPEG